jgi:hypothetical protein
MHGVAPGFGLRHEVPREDFRAAVEGISKPAATVVSLEKTLSQSAYLIFGP